MKKLIGARRAPEIYRNEIDRVPALVGCTSIGELTREHGGMRGRAAEM
jgi:isopentenyl diphosphate isomerase/L-lactate dehydrogenase-like FMN-dependent dehydrogenase